jgi:DNA-binding PadR family transcriptional regulator
MTAQRQKGFLDGMLLASLLAGPCHSSVIIERLRKDSNGQLDVPHATGYRGLRRLEKAGLVRVSCSHDEEQDRDVYELSHEGRRALEAERARWQKFRAAVTAVLEP